MQRFHSASTIDRCGCRRNTGRVCATCLFYRLAVLELPVPAFRERKDDIEPLAQAFLRREAARSGRPLHFEAAAIERLCSYSWPGNARELEIAIVRIVVLSALDERDP